VPDGGAGAVAEGLLAGLPGACEGAGPPGGVPLALAGLLPLSRWVGCWAGPACAVVALVAVVAGV